MARFDPITAGRKVIVKQGDGVVLDSEVVLQTVSPDGVCAFAAKLEDQADVGYVILYCEGVKTVLPLKRAPMSVVEENEARTGGGQ